MTNIQLINEQTLRTHFPLSQSITDTIEHAFTLLATTEVIMPPVLSMELPMVNGEVDVKTAYVPSLPTFTIKASPGFFDNPNKGLPSLSGLMIVFCAQTGLTKAVLLDNGYLTDLRTAAAGGVAARHLAPKHCPTLGIIGTGMQAKLQTLAFTQERNVERILIWGRNTDKANQLAHELSELLQKPVHVETSRQALVEKSQAVVTTTPSQTPLIDASWLHSGLHITAMGADSPVKNEIDPLAILPLDNIIVDSIAQSIERGEMRRVQSQGLLAQTSPLITLGDVCAGQQIGRQHDEQITLCDLTGTGIQDTAIANAVWTQMQRQGLGTEMPAN